MISAVTQAPPPSFDDPAPTCSRLPPVACDGGEDRDLCVLCRRARRFRRDLCRSCHRKLSGEGLPLPVDRRTLRQPVPLTTWLTAFVRALPDDARAALTTALLHHAEATDGP